MSASTNELKQQNSTLMTVERGLEVLRAFRSEKTPLSNSELVKRTGLPKATVSRLTSTLLQVGFIRHVPGSREFELAAGALGIGDAFLANNELLCSVRPYLQELADQLNVSVALAVQDGRDMLYVGYNVAKSVATLRLGIGSVLPMSTTSIGRAYLWALPEEQKIELIGNFLSKASLQRSELERSIQKSFAELEQFGTCAIMGGFQRGTFGVALPVRLGKKQILMGMSCGKADVQLNLFQEHERISPFLMAAARRMERDLANYDGLL